MNTRVPITNASTKHLRVTVKMTVATTVMKDPIALAREKGSHFCIEQNIIEKISH